MTPRAKLSWSTLISGVLASTAVGGVVVWQVQMQALDRRIGETRAALKKLHLRGQLPPNREVAEHLTTRIAVLDTQYRAALERVAPPALPATEAQADPQLHFQQRIHEVQRTVERLATARGIPLPELLGVPKELPPPDAVPRFLIQVGLIEETAELVAKVHGVSRLVSFKIEDPQPVAPGGEDDEAFLTRLPVRIKIACSLEALTILLGVVDHARPFIDLHSLRVTASSVAESQDLDVECVVARYLVSTPEFSGPDDEPRKPLGERRAKSPS